MTLMKSILSFVTALSNPLPLVLPSFNEKAQKETTVEAYIFFSYRQY